MVGSAVDVFVEVVCTPGGFHPGARKRATCAIGEEALFRLAVQGVGQGEGGG